MADKKNGSRLWFKLIAGLIVAVTFFLVIEYTVSVLYEPERDVYPGFDSDLAAFNYGIFVDDSDYIRRLRPDFETKHPRTRKIICTNSRGYRGPEFSDDKKEKTKRVVFLGDDSLFGMGLAEEDTVPNLLKAMTSDRDIETINFAVPGYTSFHGSLQAKELLPDLKPDVVVIGFGFTDAALTNYTDAQVQASIPGAQGLLITLEKFLGWSKLYELMRNKFRSREARNLLGQTRFNGNGGLEITARVPPDEFRANITSIIASARASGSRCVLLDPNLANYFAADCLKAIADAEAVPLLSARGILEEKAPAGEFKLGDARRYQRHMAIQIRGFPKDMDDSLRSPFLVKVPLGCVRFPVAPGRSFFVDDGTQGDRKAGDGLFTAIIIDEGERDFEFAPSMKILMSQEMTRQMFLNEEFFYRLPPVESLEENGIYYSPVMEFRKPAFHEYLMKFNSTLPNAEGARAITEALTPVVIKILDD